MQKYKVLESFELEGVAQEVGSVMELSDEVAAPLLESKKIELEVVPA